MDQNLSLLRIVVCTVFISLKFSNQICHGSQGFHTFSMVSAALVLIIKESYAFTIIFTFLVFFFVTSFTLSPLWCYLFIWQFYFPRDGSFWEWKETWDHQTDILFSLHCMSSIFYPVFILNYFFCIFMTCLKSLYIFCSVAYKWSFVCITVLYSTFLRINKVFWGK